MPARTVLLVDDNAELRESVGELLRGAGIAVTTTGSGAEALAALESATPDVLVTDLDMPGMDGLRLVDLVRRRWAALPVLVVTSHTGEPELARRVARGEVSVLAKPFAAGDLVGLLAAGVRPPSRPAADALARDASDAAAGRPPAAGAERRVRVLWTAVAIAVLAVLGVAAVLWHRPPPLPAPPSSGLSVRRGGLVELLAPRGEQATRPAALRWESVAGAEGYRAELRAVDDAVLWRSEIQATSVELPADLRLEPGVVYFSRVLALDERGRTLAASERVGFQIASPPSSDEVRP